MKRILKACTIIILILSVIGCSNVKNKFMQNQIDREFILRHKINLDIYHTPEPMCIMGGYRGPEAIKKSDYFRICSW